MTIAHALREGFRKLFRAWPACLVFYAATTIPALVMTVAAMAVALGSLAHSTWASQMARSFDFGWLWEMQARYGVLLSTPALIVMAGLFCISGIAYVFLLGGALTLFHAREPFSSVVFFAGCGRHFWRLARLTLCAGALVAAVAASRIPLPFIGIGKSGEPSEGAWLFWRAFRDAAALGMGGLVSLVFDYSAIRLVAEDSRHVVRAMLASCNLVWRCPGRTTGLHLALWAMALPVIAFLALSHRAPQTSLLMVLALFPIRQAAVVCKAGARLLFYAGQGAMYESLAREKEIPPGRARLGVLIR